MQVPLGYPNTKTLPDSTNPSEKMDFYVKIRNFLSLWPCDLDLGMKMKNWAPWGYAGAIVLTKYKNPCQIRQNPKEKMQIEIGYPLKTQFAIF